MTIHHDPRPGGAETKIADRKAGQQRDRRVQNPQDAAIRDAFDIANGLFREAAEDFARLRQQLRDAGLAGFDGLGAGSGRQPNKGASRLVTNSGDGLKDAVKLARELRTATQLMLEERNRVDKLRKEIAGGVGEGGALDLDAARSEIRRRLACLRRAAEG